MEYLNTNIGNKIYNLAKELFPICRSITGNGTRETLRILKRECEDLNIYEVKSGTQVFDWTVPREWNIKEAYIEDEYGNEIINMKNNNLHVLGYSIPVDKWVDLEELKQHIYTQPEQPDVIPYVTSYYKERFGFCMSENQKNSLKDIKYHMVIDSTLKEGSLSYGEIIIKGETKDEILLSTYICHPSMANNELSGPCVTIYLAKWLKNLKRRKYTYRIIFIPETIGSITYLSKNLEYMKKYTKAGFVLSCIGDDKTYSYIPTRDGNTLVDRVVKNVFSYYYPKYTKYSFLDRGSDERQYNAPGVDLPVCGICRSKYGEYPEYHTSADNMNLISSEGLQGSFDFIKKCIIALEYNEYYKTNCLCEPQLGKRGLYPTISQKGSYNEVKKMTNLLAYVDGKIDLIEISNIIGVSIEELIPIINKLKQNKLLV